MALGLPRKSPAFWRGCDPVPDRTLTMQSRSTFFAVIGGLIILLAMILTEPVCREGYSASLSFNGWVCIAGYKPQR
jgi:hypothetical protein